MADHLETKQSEPMAVEVADQTEPLSSPPSHNSDAGKIADSPPSPPVEEAEGSKMVDSEQPVHRVLGGGKRTHPLFLIFPLKCLFFFFFFFYKS